MNLEDQATLFYNLYDKQIEEVYPDQSRRINHGDIVRLFKHLSGDIFSNKCVVFRNKRKQSINFFKRELNSKIPLRRLVYMNYVDVDIKNCLIKSTCKLTGCVCINHLYKLKKKRKVRFSKSKKKNTIISWD